MTKTKRIQEPRSYYVLGQNGALGELIRCSDDGAAEVEFGRMHLSSCKRIARTRRPITKEVALTWFKGEMTAIHQRESGYNVVTENEVNTFEELQRKTRRKRETLNAY